MGFLGGLALLVLLLGLAWLAATGKLSKVWAVVVS